MHFLPRRNSGIGFVVIFILGALFLGWLSGPYRLFLRKEEMVLGGERFFVWIAEKERDRRRGLSWILWMPKNSGMLFVFAEPARYCFWNKDTFLPLRLFFIRGEEIVEERRLPPFWRGRLTVCPSQAIDKVLEIKD